MKAVPPWKHCYVDPERGVAFFDNVTIEADSINDPRQDRVFPVFKKEQIFMCRQMRPLLGTLRQTQPTLALDVGTGSGILAIWAALHGRCKVYAVDISERAIEFARHNAQTNHVKVFEFTTWTDFIQAKGAGIWLQHLRFDKILADKLLQQVPDQSEGCFDLVMLNAPYNPTFPGVTPALHANGGPDGQAEFREQIRQVPRLLRTGGYCAAHHMGVIAPDAEHPNVVSEIQEAFKELNDERLADTSVECREAVGYGAEGYYIKILKDDRNVRDFLKSQYSTYLASSLHRDSVQRYVDDVASEWKTFSLLYFQFKKQLLTHTTPVVPMDDQTDLGKRPQHGRHVSVGSWSWKTREWLHRCIVEHTASTISIPWASLFTPYIVSEQTLTQPDTPSPKEATSPATAPTHLMAQSPMRLVDQWLSGVPPFQHRQQSSARIQPAKHCKYAGTGRDLAPFDFVHIESVPFTPNAARLPGLQQESALWLSRHEGRTDADYRLVAQRCFGAWKACVRAAHQAVIAPFLHPVFMGASSGEFPARTWNPLIQSYFRHEGDHIFPVHPTLRDLVSASASLHVQLSATFSTLRENALQRADQETANDSLAVEPIPLDGATQFASYLTTSALGELSVAQADAYRSACNARIAQLGSRDPRERQRVSAIDLEYCHTSLHVLAAYAFAQAVRSVAPSGLKWSYLLSIPLDLSDPLSPVAEGVLPSTFRGGVFSFVGSFCEHWHPRQDRLILNLARFLTLLHNGRFNVEEARSQTFDVLAGMGRSVSHEILAHKLVMDIAHQPLRDVFSIAEADTSKASANAWHPPAGTISTAEVDTPTMQSWLVCPIPDVYNGFSDMLSFWGSDESWLQEKKLHLRRPFGDALAEIVSIVGRVAAAENWSPGMPPRSVRDAAGTDAAFLKYLTRILGALGSIEYQGDARLLEWAGGADTFPVQFSFVRLMSAALGNAIKHLPKGSSALVVRAYASPERSELEIEVENEFVFNGEKPPRHWGTLQVIDTVLRDRWGPRAIRFEDLRPEDATLGSVHQWLTAFAVPLTFLSRGERVTWLRRS
jgi:SAM-dependent methyltransferase